MACFLRLGYRRSVVTVWTDGSGRHSSDPQHRCCGVGYCTDTQERVFLPLSGIKQSVYRAELHAVARALRNASHMKWSATAKDLSRLFRPCKQAEDNPKGGTETLSNEFKMHSSLASAYVGSRRT
eukprot:6303192-Amphidinium_carterae.1